MSKRERETHTHREGGRGRERRGSLQSEPTCVCGLYHSSAAGGGEETGRFHKNRTVRDGTFTNVKIQTKQTFKNKTKTETSGTLVMF